MQILEHKFVKLGDKKVRRAKLYYVRKWPFTRFTIPWALLDTYWLELHRS